MSHLLYLDAVELSSLYRNRKLSPKELMQAIITRSEKINPKINALSENFYERALAQSVRLEQAFQKGESLGPLAGIPVTTKEKHPIKGETITHGLSLTKAPLSNESHIIIDRILEADGIIHSRSTTPEFSCATFTHSTQWGIT